MPSGFATQLHLQLSFELGNAPRADRSTTHHRSRMRKVIFESSATR
jgi:hypothetical protein